MAYSQVSSACVCLFPVPSCSSHEAPCPVGERHPLEAAESCPRQHALTIPPTGLLLTRWYKVQELWRDFLRDFVVEVVRRPVVAVGNSIGGYISASLAGDYPALVSGEAWNLNSILSVWKATLPGGPRARPVPGCCERGGASVLRLGNYWKRRSIEHVCAPL